MATSCAPTTQPRNHRERVLAQDAMNNQAFPMGDLLKPRCKKTADEMRAEMDGWGTETGFDASQAVNPHYHKYQAKAAARAVKASSIVSVPIDAEQDEPNATIAIQSKRECRRAAQLVKIYKETKWCGMDDEERRDAAYDVLTDDAAWNSLSIEAKADIARDLTYVSPLQTEKDAEGGTVFYAYVESPHSNVIYKVCFSKNGHVFKTYAPTQEQTALLAGRLTWHMVAFHMAHGAKLQAECGKIALPWLQTDAETGTHCARVATYDVSPEQIERDF